jgi:hypothetical protein
MNGAMIRGRCDHIRLINIRWNRIRGFGILFTDNGYTGDWPEHVTIRDSVIRGGEMGIAIVAGRHIDIIGNQINDSTWFAIDLEPDQPQHGFEDVLIKDNDIRRYGWGDEYTSWFVAANPSDDVVDDVVMNGLVVTGNRVHAGIANDDNSNAGIGGLSVRADKANIKRNFVITNNWTVDNHSRSSSRSVINLANVHNLTITGNRQPVQAGSFLDDENTTGRRVVRNNRLQP